VLYPVVPRFSFRTWSGRLAFFLAFAAIVAAFTVPQYFFFPMGLLYITWGLVRTVVAGFEEKLPDRDPLILEEPAQEETRELDYEEMRPRREQPLADEEAT